MSVPHSSAEMPDRNVEEATASPPDRFLSSALSTLSGLLADGS